MVSCSAVMRAVHIEEYGGPENLVLEGNVPRPKEIADHILLKIYSTAVNRADILQRKGVYAPIDSPWRISGLECAGVVEATGEGVGDMFLVGEKVMALLTGGGYAEYVLVHKHQVMKIPAHMNFTEAAAIPEVWLTAHQLLYLVAGYQPGETVLVHAAGSGVGTAAIQLVKADGGKVIAVAGGSHKLVVARTLGADYTINYKQGDFSEGVTKFTEGEGADIILDCVGGSNWERNANSLAVDGRWVLYGLLGGGHIEGDLFKKLLSKRASLLTSLLRPRSVEYKRELIQSFMNKSFLKFLSGELRPIIDSVMPLAKVVEAHKRMEANQNIGKIILTVVDESSDESKQEL